MTTKKQTTDNLSKSVERSKFIDAMRSLASSVTVVTSDGEAGCHGATVSAFCSVSADPPTVLICLHADSRISEAVVKNGVFCVNVLPESYQKIADRFAGRLDNVVEDRFEGVACQLDVDSAPIIVGSTSFRCDINNNFISGSHRIFIGEVTEIKGDIPAPLIYYKGNYHHIKYKNNDDINHTKTVKPLGELK